LVGALLVVAMTLGFLATDALLVASVEAEPVPTATRSR
jgi:hypothetical protein